MKISPIISRGVDNISTKLEKAAMKAKPVVKSTQFKLGAFVGLTALALTAGATLVKPQARTPDLYYEYIQNNASQKPKLTAREVAQNKCQDIKAKLDAEIKSYKSDISQMQQINGILQNQENAYIEQQRKALEPFVEMGKNNIKKYTEELEKAKMEYMLNFPGSKLILD